MFKPNLVQLLLTILGLLFFSSLALWQFTKGLDKDSAITQMNRNVAPISFSASTAYQALVKVKGTYLPYVLFLNNQIYEGVPGLNVYGLLQTEQGALFVIDRGWMLSSSISITEKSMPADSAVWSKRDVAISKLPSGEQEIEGYWLPLPQAGMKTDIVAKPSWRQERILLNYPTFEYLKALLTMSPLDEAVKSNSSVSVNTTNNIPALYNGRIVQTNNPENSELVRDVSPENLFGVTPERHYGYALTWAGFLIATIILFLIFARRRAIDIQGDGR